MPFLDHPANGEQRFTVGETAAKLGISRQAVLARIKRGRLDAERAGRFYLITADTLAGLLAGQKCTSGAAFQRSASEVAAR